MDESEVTRLLSAAGGGDRVAFQRLYSSVYEELRRMAASQMRRERHALTLQPTALVNEAYLRLAPASAGFENRRHFFCAAAEAMRRILVDQARRRGSQKRGAGFERVTLAGVDVPASGEHADVLDIDAALAALAAQQPRLGDLVKLRYFAGLSIEAAAQALDISPATAKRDWQFARAWLRQQLESQHPP